MVAGSDAALSGTGMPEHSSVGDAVDAPMAASTPGTAPVTPPTGGPKGSFKQRLPLVVVGVLCALLVGAGAWLLMKPGAGEGPAVQRDALPPAADEQDDAAKMQANAAVPDDQPSAAELAVEQGSSAGSGDQASERPYEATSIAPEAPVQASAAVGAEEQVKTPVSTRGGVASAGPFRIIAGAFRSADNASSYVGKLQAAGYPAELRLQGNGLHMVVLSRHASMEDARSALESYSTTMGGGAYIAKGR